MAEKEKVSIRRSSHSVIHGEGCGGAVVFPKDSKAIVQDGVCEKCHKIVHKNCGGTIITTIDGGRECNRCRRQETHAIGQYFIVGQPGVSQEKLETLCKELKLQILKVLPDASYPEIIALLVAVSETETILSPKLLGEIIEKLVKNKDTVRYVYDKPIAYDRYGEPTKYREE